MSHRPFESVLARVKRAIDAEPPAGAEQRAWKRFERAAFDEVSERSASTDQGTRQRAARMAVEHSASTDQRALRRAARVGAEPSVSTDPRATQMGAESLASTEQRAWQRAARRMGAEPAAATEQRAWRRFEAEVWPDAPGRARAWRSVAALGVALTVAVAWIVAEKTTPTTTPVIAQRFATPAGQRARFEFAGFRAEFHEQTRASVAALAQDAALSLELESGTVEVRPVDERTRGTVRVRAGGHTVEGRAFIASVAADGAVAVSALEDSVTVDAAGRRHLLHRGETWPAPSAALASADRGAVALAEDRLAASGESSTEAGASSTGTADSPIDRGLAAALSRATKAGAANSTQRSTMGPAAAVTGGTIARVDHSPDGSRNAPQLPGGHDGSATSGGASPVASVAPQHAPVPGSSGSSPSSTTGGSSSSAHRLDAEMNPDDASASAPSAPPLISASAGTVDPRAGERSSTPDSRSGRGGTSAPSALAGQVPPNSSASAPASGGTVTAAAQPDDATRWAEANRLVKAGRYSEALGALDSIANGHGAFAEMALYESGRVRARYVSDDAGALSRFRAYRSRYPNGSLAPEVTLSLIEALLRTGALDQALDESDAFLASSPGTAQANDVRLVRAHILREQGRFDAALAAYQALDHRAGGVGDDATYYEAFCAQKLGRNADARALLLRYREVFPRGRHRDAVEQALAGDE